MTTPTFLATDETAFDDDRALTAEHGRRLIRNALAIWNERCGFVGHSELLVAPDGSAISSRVIITANWAYVGPLQYYCPGPVGNSNGQRPIPSVRLRLGGRASGSATSFVYALNQDLGIVSESEMSENVLSPGPAYASITGSDWSANLTVSVKPGWNRLWIGFKCGVYGVATDLEEFISGFDRPPYLATLVADTGRFGANHPAVLAANVVSASVPPYALQLSVSPAGRAGGSIKTYTCPLRLENPGKDPIILDGMHFIWEGLQADLLQIGPILATNVDTPYFGTEPSMPITAFRQSLDVINLDSLTVDASQVWETEDLGQGAGLRWFQLPSAIQYRTAGNWTESTRRAVCPMVSIMNEVTQPTIVSPYPLAGSPKPYTWAISIAATGRSRGVLVSLDSLPPFAVPDTEVTFEACFSLAAVSSLMTSTTESLSIQIRLFDYVTGLPLVANTINQPIVVMNYGRGGLNGNSILTRTISWAVSYQREPNRTCDYGQEGLTLRGDWYNWQDYRLSVTIPRSSLPTNPVVLVVSPTIVVPPADLFEYAIAFADLAVRISGG